MSRAETAAPDPQIAPLTALRFFAAAWVVLFHWWPTLALPAASGLATPALAAKGYLGVELFFVLSGFVISYVYQGAAEAGRFRYGAFLWARLARVYPLHLATLAGVALMGLAALAVGRSVGGEVLDLEALPANLLLVHAWGLSPSAAFNHPSWSISAEWFAYLCFPAFAWAAMQFRGRPWLAVFAALLLLLAAYAGFERFAGFPLTQATIAWGALRIVPCFALGCATHLLWRSGALRGRRTAIAGTLAALAAIVLLAQMRAADALLTACFGALVFSLAGLWSTRPDTARTSRPLAVFAYLGEISYSTYMICVPWKLLATNGLGGADGRLESVLWAVCVAALIPLSALSFHLIERPARAWLKAHRPTRLGSASGATYQPAT